MGVPRKYVVVFLLAVFGPLASCGGGDHPPGPTDQDLARLGLTRDVPARLTAVCREIQGRLTVAVYCPPVVPRSIPAPPRIEHPGPLAIGFSHGRITRVTRDYYEVNVESGSWLDHMSLGHWIFAGGSPLITRRRIHALPLTEPPRTVGRAVLSSRNVRIAGLRTSVKRMARYPEGGINGGHVLVLWRFQGRAYYVSIHGYANEKRATVIAQELIGEMRSCPNASGPVLSRCD